MSLKMVRNFLLYLSKLYLISKNYLSTSKFKSYMKKIISSLLMFVCILAGTLFTTPLQAQGACWAKGGEVPINGIMYFVCPAGGLYITCNVGCPKQ
jgi:hypothetical protein